MKRPVIDMDQCILCGLCPDVSPSVFIMNDLGFISIAELDEYPEDEVDEDIKNCPKDCIRWE